MILGYNGRNVSVFRFAEQVRLAKVRRNEIEIPYL